MSYLFDELKSQDAAAPIEDKILLMGLQQAGKTAIKDVVFFGKEADEVEDYMATIHYERQFLDKEKKSLIIDSGGQESYWNEAVTHFRHLVFSNVKLLLWIIDMTRPDLFEESERRFSFTIRQYKKENPDGHIGVLCHKVDQISPEELVPLLDHVKDSLNEERYDIRFEPSSIYYPDSLKELIFNLMKDAGMDVKRFELITNLGQKVAESEEFQAYKIEHKEDPRIQQLMDFLNPKPEATLPTYGKTSVAFDLSTYDIIEIVLIDKETFSPITGTSSRHMVSVEKSMDYISALKDFKDIIKTKKFDDKSTINIITSSNEKVHGMIFNLTNKFLLITTFSPITDEKTKIYYKLVRDFAQQADGETVVVPIEAPTKAPTKAPIVAPTTAAVKAPTIAPTKPKPATVKPTKAKPTPKSVAPVTPVATGKIKEDSKSMFSFLNKLKDEHELQIEEEKLAPKEPEIVSTVETAPVTHPTTIPEAPKPKITETVPPVTETKEESIVEPPVVTPPTEQIIEETPKVEETAPEPAKVEEVKKSKSPFLEKLDKERKTEKTKKPKSRFLEKIDKERKSYKIRQVKISSLENSGTAESEEATK